jgi:hypothetical protein
MSILNRDKDGCALKLRTVGGTALEGTWLQCSSCDSYSLSD